MKIYTKDEAKEVVKKLIEKFDRLSPRAIKNFSEADTRRAFILPLFHALGWDVYNDRSENEVVEEETSISGRIDYSFRINNITQFLLEAKKISEDLDKVKWARQAIEYGWNKEIPWVVLTDFEGLKVFNSEWKKDKPLANIDLSYKEYIDKFDKLWLLSRDEIRKGELDKRASEWGITAKRISVNEVLAEDLVKWRDILTNNLRKWNDEYNHLDIQEAVQRILDRLIFIRVVEDRKLEDKFLWQSFQKWKSGKNSSSNFITTLTPLFRKFDNKYNSNLFEKHLCEDLYSEGNPFREIIPQLYREKEKGVKYRFDAIDADVLGAVYEQYLGTIQQREGETSKRKKQGIYYTPTYIVDYIIQNTVGKILQEKRTLKEKEDIKVLDPACGSGSFLIKAFEVIDEHLKQFRNHKSSEYDKAASRKYSILTENIYGVDLDEQANEISRLNLLIKALVPSQKLPLLTKSLKVGNSLIFDSDNKLKKYFGVKFRRKKPFNWKEEFPEVFKHKGFDVIIGNPPWGTDIDEESKYFANKYPNSTKKYKDIYKVFIDRAISLLKPKGYLGFIIPSTFLYQPRYQDIKSIIDQYEYFVVNLGEKIFKGVQLPSCILILRKVKGMNRFIVDLTQIDRKTLPLKLLSIDPEKKEAENKLKVYISKKGDFRLEDVFLLKDAGINYQAVNIGKAKKGHSKLGKLLFYKGKKIKKIDVEYWKGSHIDKFFIQKQTNHFVRTDYESFKQKNERVILNKEFFKLTPKLLWRQTASSIIATVDTRGVWFGRSIQGAVLKEKYKNKVDVYYALAILNSKYFDYLYKQKVFETGRLFPQVKLKYLRNLPFILGEKQQQSISLKTKKIIKLKKELQLISKKTEKWENLKREIEKLIEKINREVYKLYNLTLDEIEIINKN